MIKLIAIDLDGTLLRSDKTLSAVNRQALHYANDRGVKIVVCTGRPFLAAQHIIEEIGLNTIEDYVVTFNGGQIQNAQNGEIIHASTIPAWQMWQWYDELTRIDLPLNIIDRDWVYEPLTYPDDVESIYVSDITTAPHRQVDFRCFDRDHGFLKMVVATPEPILKARISHLSPTLAQDFSTYFSQAHLFEVVKKGVSKGQALIHLSRLTGIATDEMMSLGDQENDLTMIKTAGIGVAMGNAIDAVKATADYITDTNNEDGVAKAIYHFLAE